MRRTQKNPAVDAERRQRRAEAFACSAIEGQPPSQGDIEMFEMFDREGLSFEERRAYIVAQAKRDGDATLVAE